MCFDIQLKILHMFTIPRKVNSYMQEDEFTLQCDVCWPSALPFYQKLVKERFNVVAFFSQVKCICTLTSQSSYLSSITKEKAATKAAKSKLT